MIFSNCALIIYLKRKETIMTEMLGNVSVFTSEKIKLSLITLAFVLGYSIDFLFYYYIGFVGHKPTDNKKP